MHFLHFPNNLSSDATKVGKMVILPLVCMWSLEKHKDSDQTVYMNIHSHSMIIQAAAVNTTVEIRVKVWMTVSKIGKCMWYTKKELRIEKAREMFAN